MCGAGGGRGGRSHGGTGAGRGRAGKIRRRFARRASPKLRRILRAASQLLKRNERDDLSNCEIWRSRAGDSGGAGDRVRRQAEEACRGHVRVDV